MNFKAENEKKFSLINNWIVEMFENLLVTAKNTDDLTDPESLKIKLIKYLNREIKL